MQFKKNYIGVFFGALSYNFKWSHKLSINIKFITKTITEPEKLVSILLLENSKSDLSQFETYINFVSVKTFFRYNVFYENWKKVLSYVYSILETDSFGNELHIKAKVILKHLKLQLEYTQLFLICGSTDKTIKLTSSTNKNNYFVLRVYFLMGLVWSTCFILNEK